MLPGYVVFRKFGTSVALVIATCAAVGTAFAVECSFTAVTGEDVQVGRDIITDRLSVAFELVIIQAQHF